MLEKKYLSAKDLTEYLGISIATVWRWVKNGTIPYCKLGGKTYFVKDEIDKLFVKNS